VHTATALQVPVTVSPYLPIGQAPQADDAEKYPASVEKYPAGQLAHEAWPVLPWNLPRGQALQVPEPASGLNQPVAQATHAEPG
jgi:hypothetical protein